MKFDLCAIGTMAWGTSIYGKIVQGKEVDKQTLIQTLDMIDKSDLTLIDTAHKYGFGYAEKLIGNHGCNNLVISTKFTPGNRKKAGALTKAFEQDLIDLHREYVDIYWLHLPIKIEQNLKEIIPLYKDGKIKRVGVSNFNLEEMKQAKNILSKEGISLYGVQNHYSLLARDWDDNGVIRWCHENKVKFYAWSIMEQGALTGKTHFSKLSVRGFMYNKKLVRLKPLFETMNILGKRYGLSIAQVNIVWAVSKGIVPICGCRKPYQVQELAKAIETRFAEDEIEQLEKAAKDTGVTIKGDMFRNILKFA